MLQRLFALLGIHPFSSLSIKEPVLMQVLPHLKLLSEGQRASLQIFKDVLPSRLIIFFVIFKEQQGHM